jgi:hypothetical protein
MRFKSSSETGSCIEVPGIPEPVQIFDGGLSRGLVGNACLVLYLGMLASIDETRILLGGIVAGHAHEQDMIAILPRIGDDDPKVPVGGFVRQVEGLSGLHASGPE